MAEQKRYTMRERYEYHANIANTGKGPDGKPVSTVSRVNHAIKADNIRKQRNSFLKGVQFASEKR